MREDEEFLALLEKRMPALSKGQRCIATFLLEHYDDAAYMTAARLGEITGVSESTVVRFAIELGYDGYPGMQKELRKLVKNSLTAARRVKVSAEHLTRNDTHVLKSVLQGDAERILSTLREIDYKEFDVCVDAIVKARRIYVVGGRSSSMIASFLAFYLNIMRDDVFDVSSAAMGDVYDRMFRITEGDLCIGISFPRYSQRTIRAMEYAEEHKATTIVITDSPESPVGRLARHTLIAKSDMLSFVDSLVAAMSIINALVVAVSVKCEDEVVDTLNKLESLWGESGVYSRKKDPN